MSPPTDDDDDDDDDDDGIRGVLSDDIGVGGVYIYFGGGMRRGGGYRSRDDGRLSSESVNLPFSECVENLTQFCF